MSSSTWRSGGSATPARWASRSAWRTRAVSAPESRAELAWSARRADVQVEVVAARRRSRGRRAAPHAVAGTMVRGRLGGLGRGSSRRRRRARRSPRRRRSASWASRPGPGRRAAAPGAGPWRRARRSGHAPGGQRGVGRLHRGGDVGPEGVDGVGGLALRRGVGREEALPWGGGGRPVRRRELGGHALIGRCLAREGGAEEVGHDGGHRPARRRSSSSSRAIGAIRRVRASEGVGPGGAEASRSTGGASMPRGRSEVSVRSSISSSSSSRVGLRGAAAGAEAPTGVGSSTGAVTGTRAGAKADEGIGSSTLGREGDDGEGVAARREGRGAREAPRRASGAAWPSDHRAGAGRRGPRPRCLAAGGVGVDAAQEPRVEGAGRCTPWRAASSVGFGRAEASGMRAKSDVAVLPSQ